MVYLFPISFLLVLAWHLLWLRQAKINRLHRIRRVLNQKMALAGLDEWSLGRLIGMPATTIIYYMLGDKPMDAALADGLRTAFPETTPAFWFKLDRL